MIDLLGTLLRCFGPRGNALDGYRSPVAVVGFRRARLRILLP